MSKYKRIFVIGYAPSTMRDGHTTAGTGGFDWVNTWDDVRYAMESMNPHAGHDYRIAAIEVPSHLDGDDLTKWLDERPSLCDPPATTYDEDEDEVAGAVPMSKEAALVEILAATSEHRAANLDGANMDGIVLFRTNLRNAKMRNASLRGAQLLGADMFGADLSDADLSDANMGEANLAHANLVRADLSRANLFHVNLLGTRMDGAVLEGTDMTGAQLGGMSVTGVDTDDLLKALGIKR